MPTAPGSISSTRPAACCAAPTPRARSSPSDSLPDDPDETTRPGRRRPGGRHRRPVLDRRLPRAIRASGTCRVVDRYIEASAIHSVMAVPLTDENGPFGALLVSSGRPDAWSEADAEPARDDRRPGRRSRSGRRASSTSSTGRATPSRRRAGAEQALREIAARITVLREPGEILRTSSPRRAAWSGRTASSSTCSTRRPATCTGRSTTGCPRCSAPRSGRACGSRSASARPGSRSPRTGSSSPTTTCAAQFPPSPEVDRVLRADRLPLDDRGADHRRRPARSGSSRSTRRQRAAFTETDARPRRRARQPGRHRDHQRPAHRGARPLARRAGPDRRRRADAARDRRPGQRDARPGRDPAGRHRRVGPAARRDRGDDRPARRHRAWPRPGRVARRASGRPRTCRCSSEVSARPRRRRVRPLAADPPGRMDRLLPRRRPVHPHARARRVRARDRHPLGHRRAARPPRRASVGAITVYGDRPDAFDEADAALLSARSPTRRPSRSPTRGSSTSSSGRGRRSPGAPTRSRPCARSRRACRPSSSPTRSSSRSSTRRPACSSPTAPGSTCTTRRSTRCAGRTRRARRWRSSRTGRRPAASSPARPWPAPPSPSSAPVRTDDYLVDERFVRDDPAREFVASIGHPLGRRRPAAPATAGPLGTLSVVSRQVAAYDDADGEVLTALATQASIAIRNARLIDELARSRAVIERRAEAEQALREIAARITAIREPGDLLQRIVDEARRLLRADGAVIDEYDARRGRPRHGLRRRADRRAARRPSAPRGCALGEGLSGRAMAEGRVIAAGDYLDRRVPARRAHRRPRPARPGSATSSSRRSSATRARSGRSRSTAASAHAFDDIDAAVLGGLADQAAIAITNARLIEELERSQAAVARRADTERALRDITARIAALREPEVILDRVVEEAQPAARHGRRAPHPDERRRDVSRPGRRRRRQRPRDPDAGCWGCTSRSMAGSTAWRRRAARPVWTSDYTDRSAHPARRNDDEAVARRLACAGWRPLRCAPPAARSSARSRSRRRCHARSPPRSSTCSRAWPTRRPSPSPTRRC